MKAGLTIELLGREWRQRPGRFCLTVASVAIGTAAVFGALLASASTRKAYQEVSESLEGPPALEIASEQGGRFSLSAIGDLSAIQGIAAEVPLVLRTSLLRVRERRATIIVIGTTLEKSEIAQRLRLQAGTLPPAGSDDGLLSAPLADAFQVQPGDEVTLLTRRGLRRIKIAGILERESMLQLAPGGGVVMHLAAVQQLFNLRDQVDQVRLDLQPNVDREAAKAVIAARLQAPLVVQLPESRIRLAKELLRSSDIALTMVCTMAAAMAAFIVLNTVRINVTERRRQLSIMRCIGATPRQVELLIVSEAFAAGILGALVGVPLGFGVGWGVTRGMEKVLATQIPSLSPNYWAAIGLAACGPLLAVIAAWVPARQAQRIAPSEALRDAQMAGYDSFPWTSVIVGFSLSIVGDICILGMLQRWLPPITAVPAAVLLLVCFVLWLPILLQPILRATIVLFPGPLRLAAQLGYEQLIRRRKRTGLTAGVIVVALNCSIGLGHAVLNNVRDVHDWYHRTFAGDFFLQTVTPLTSSLAGQDDPLRQAIAELPGVLGVDTIRIIPAQAGDQPVVVLVRDFPEASPLPLQLIGISESEARAGLGRGQVILATVLARRLNLKRGDHILVKLDGRSHRFEICALTPDYFQGGMALYLAHQSAQQLMNTGQPDFYSVRGDHAALEHSERQLRDLARQYNAAFFSAVEGRQRFDRRVNGIVGALWSVIGLTFIASGLGIANTLSVNVLEQTQELGLMRIIGMTRRQLLTLILVEAWMLGMLGIVLGVAGGLVTAYVCHLASDPVLGHSPPFAWHFGLLTLSIGGCLLLVSLGALALGFRASKLNLLTTISYE